MGVTGMSTLIRTFRALALLALLVIAGLSGNAFAAKTYPDNGDGTVTDPTTGLTWMRCSMGQTWSGSTCTGTVSTYTWDQANALTGTVTFAGQSDWRLPNIRELTTIVDLSVFDPAIDQRAFPVTPGSDFWSGSPYANYSGYAWYVGFDYGNAFSNFRSYGNAVRLVRGGQSLTLLAIARPTTDYVDQGDGTVTHSPTGLTWKRCAQGQTWSGSSCTGTASTYTWDQANALTGAVAFAGQSDWRLPSRDELLSLVEYTRFSPAINATIFPATPSSDFWSGSPYAYYSYYAWYLNFDDGNAYGNFRSYDNAVRLVRGGQSFGTFALTVGKSGAGNVSSALAGIDCGSVCTGNYTAGTKVILTAAPVARLLAWSGACAGAAATCTVTLDAAKTVSASFMDAPVISGLPASLLFPLQNVGSTSPTQTVTLTNSGTTALAISSITASGDYAVTHNCGSGLGVNGFCTLNISFKPTAVGARTGTVSIASNAPGSPHTIALSGTGQGGTAVASSSTLTFASQGIGIPSAAQTLTLSNTGGATLNIASITTTGEFSRTTTCGSALTVGNSCSISVVFTPTAGGARNGSLTIAHDGASGNPIIVSLSGTGVAVPAAALSPTALTFANQPLGTSSAVQTITFNNIGAAALTLISIAASGDFAQSNNCGGGLGAGGSCSINVVFTPTAVGTRTGAVTIANNSANNPVATVSLTGVVIQYVLNAGKSGTGSGTVSSSPAGINCGLICSANLASGTSVTLTATSATGSTFTGWSGACTNTTGSCVVTMSQAQSVTANFAIKDSIPDAFSFTPQTGVATSATVTSNTVTPTGYNAANNISVIGGLYSVGCTGTFTSLAGIINPGQSVCVRHTAATTALSTVTTTLTMGGVSGSFSSTTAASPPVAPVVVSFSPTNGATGVAIGSDIVLTFSKAIQLGVGDIVIKTATGAVVATYNAASSSNLSISGNTLTLNSSNDLSIYTKYLVEVSAGAIKDLAGINYVSSGAYTFRTETIDGLYHFFVVAFAAAPGVDYMTQLADADNYGLSVKEIVAIFTTKPQFTVVYPASLTNQQFADALVANIIKASATDSAKTAAAADIVAAMGGGWSRGDVIYTVFGNLVTKPLTDTTWGNTAKQFRNQLEVARYLTEVMEFSSTDLPTLQSVLASVTQDTDVSTPQKIAQIIYLALGI